MNFIQYRIAFTNTGDGQATHVVISDTLPTGLENILITTSGLTISQVSSSPLRFEIVDIQPGMGDLITITAGVENGFVGNLVNAVEISSAGELPDRLADNRAETQLSIASPNLEISKSGILTRSAIRIIGSPTR